MIDLLTDSLRKVPNFDYIEIRHRRSEMTNIKINDGVLEEASSGMTDGIGVRVLHNGAWGFAATSSPEKNNIVDAAIEAGSMAKKGAKYIHTPSKLAEIRVCKENFKAPFKIDLKKMSIEEKLEKLSDASKWIQTAKNVASFQLLYNEHIEEVSFINSEGSMFQRSSQKPGLIASVVMADDQGNVRPALESYSKTCGAEFFEMHDPLETIQLAHQEGKRLLGAKTVKGGIKRVVLHHRIVGLLAHEAIGHTAESDLVLAGSFLKDKIGESVANELITLCDSPVVGDAAGWIPVDDEGVIGKKVVIIQNGELENYMVNRDDGFKLQVKPTGNARAYSHKDIPIVRMRNTYIEQGDMTEEELIETTKEGYYIKGVMGGEADSNGEFMFGAREALEIKNGKLTGVSFVGPSISGNSFDVLKSVEGVGKDFQMDLGFGFCGKIQVAKVDAGGPLLACTALLGGR